MTEHFTREEATTWEALQIADKGRQPVAVYMQAEIDTLRAVLERVQELLRDVKHLPAQSSNKGEA